LNTVLSDEELKILEEEKSELEYASSELIQRQGGFISEILLVRSGLVKNVLEGRNDRNTILKLFGGGKFVDFPIEGGWKQYPYSIISVTRSEICLISRDTLNHLSSINTDLKDFILIWYSRDYKFMYEKLATISTRNSHGKVATTLIYLTEGNFGDNILKILSRKEIAELSSTSVESTNKILRQLYHDGLIDISENEIIIQRRDLLERLSTVG